MPSISETFISDSVALFYNKYFERTPEFNYGMALSTNHGNSWKSVFKSWHDKPVSAIYPISPGDSAGIMIIKSGDIKLSYDQGQSWSTLSAPDAVDSVITAAADTTYNSLYAAASYPDSLSRRGEVYQYHFGNSQWNKTGLNKRVDLLSVNRSGQLLAGVHSSDTLYKFNWTPESWEKIPTGKATSIQDVILGENERIFLATGQHGVQSTDDHGETWSRLTASRSPDKVFDLTTDLEGHLYMGTETGVYKSNDIVVSDINKRETDLPSEITLSKNYPNPFNPTTNIDFSLPQASDVQLHVYDILGRHVATLLSGKQEAGRHTVTFDAGNLASGVYIYRLVTEQFSQSRKMLLIK